MKSYLVAVALAAILAPALATSAFAKTSKECTAEWRANKEANQAAKITEKAYIAKCKSTDATPSASPVAAPAAKSAPAAPKAAAPAAPQAPATKTVAKPAAPATGVTGANEFASDTQAKAKCPSDTVVWVNLSSKIYHFAGKKDYGKTKKGTYMCEKDAVASGSRAAKDEKHP